MMRCNRIAAIVLFAVSCPLFLAACGTAAGPAPSETASPPPVVTQTPAPTPAPTPDPVANLISTMTTEEKVGQLLVVGIGGLSAETAAAGELTGRRAVVDYHAGGVIFFRRNIQSAEQALLLTNSLRALNAGRVPLLLGVDQEGGPVDRTTEELVKLPAAYDVHLAARGLPNTSAVMTELGGVLALQTKAMGCNLDFAPTADIWSHPENTVIGKRAYGSDAETVATAAAQVSAGLTQEGIISVYKHFPGHGDTVADSHTDLPAVDKTAEELMEFELLPFAAGIDGGQAAVMAAHILVTSIDPDRPASLSAALINGLLREKLGFDGVVFTDDLTMGAIADRYSIGEAAVLAVEAGCDQLLVCHGSDNVDEVYRALLKAADSGRISTERLDGSLRRILRLKTEFALTDDPAPGVALDEVNAAAQSLLSQIEPAA